MSFIIILFFFYIYIYFSMHDGRKQQALSIYMIGQFRRLRRLSNFEVLFKSGGMLRL